MAKSGENEAYVLPKRIIFKYFYKLEYIQYYRYSSVWIATLLYYGCDWGTKFQDGTKLLTKLKFLNQKLSYD